jgi:hypothetical protein
MNHEQLHWFATWLGVGDTFSVACERVGVAPSTAWRALNHSRDPAAEHARQWMRLQPDAVSTISSQLGPVSSLWLVPS